MKEVVKQILPPFLYSLFKRMRGQKYGWTGNYNSWGEAVQASEGYDSDKILSRVMDSRRKVDRDEAVFERDGVAFREPHYNWPLIASLLMHATRHDGQLDVIDFGGSIGSTYFQNRDFFSGLKKVSWNVVEQDHFVEAGKEHFEDGVLRFFTDVSQCIDKESSQLLFISGTLQYIEEPYRLLGELMDYGFKTIIIDRMPFNRIDENRICVQKVHPSIYDVSYPSHLLSLPDFLAFFASRNYELAFDFDAIDSDTDNVLFKGFVFNL